MSEPTRNVYLFDSEGRFEVKTFVAVCPKKFYSQAAKEVSIGDLLNIKWFELVSCTDNYTSDAVDCKFQLNYATVKDSPLHEVLKTLNEGGLIDWQGKYYRECLNSESLRSELEVSQEELSGFHQTNSRPTLYFIHLMICTYIINIFSKLKRGKG